MSRLCQFTCVAAMLALGSCQSVGDDGPTPIGAARFADAGAGGGGSMLPPSGGMGGGSIFPFPPDAATGGGAPPGPDVGPGHDAAPVSDADPTADARLPDASRAADAARPADGATGCDHPFSVTATLVEDRLFTRADPVEIRFEADTGGEAIAVTWQFEADRGGRIRERADHVFWAAGGVDPGDVPWPWWTGEVEVTVSGGTPGGCVARDHVRIRLAGDVLVAEGSRGYLFAYGSDGRSLGRFRQVSDLGLRAVIRVPEAEGGGLLISTRARADRPPEIHWIDREGGPIVDDFEMTDLIGEPIYEDDDSPRHLAWDPNRREIVGDQVGDRRLARWNLRGEFVGFHTFPCERSCTGQSVGLGVFGDGGVVAGLERQRDLYVVDADGPRAYTETESDIWAVAPGRNGQVVVVSQAGNDISYTAYDTGGGTHAQVEFFNITADYLIPFLDHYLATAGRGISIVRRHQPDLSLPDPYQWQQDPNFDDISWAAGLVWLHPDE